MFRIPTARIFDKRPVAVNYHVSGTVRVYILSVTSIPFRLSVNVAPIKGITESVD